MLKCASLRVPAVCAGVLAIVIVLDTSARADNCLLAPTRAAAPGTRWVYQTDRATDRKCWYLIGAGGAPVAQPPENSSYDPYHPSAPGSPYPPPQQPSALDLFFSLTTGSSSQSDATGGDARAALGTRPDNAPIEAKPRLVRQPKAEANLAPKPHRPPPAAPGDAEPQAPLTSTEREALFTEFLHWQQQQSPSQ